MLKTTLLAGLAALGLLLGCAHESPATPNTACAITCGALAVRTAQRVDQPATHGMLIVGDQTIYLSHLPMFHAPHDYQVIVEAHFRAAQGNPEAAYVADRAKTGTAIYTLVPQPFVLPDVVQNKRSFKATIFRGHFERGGTPILKNITVDITRVLLFKQFDPHAQQPAGLDYFLFGQGAETFLAHLIVAPPDYDQVVAVQPQTSVPDALKAQGLAVSVPGRSHDQPVQAGNQVQVVAPTLGAALPLGVTTEFYHETGDLAQ